jgi:cation diffusion facilitator family transporter
MIKNDVVRDKTIRRIILIEGLVNFLVLAIKVTVGLATGSLAILGDAIHSLTDVANNVIAWVVVRLSSLPPDREHPYGHRKFETLAVFGLATLLTVVAFELAMRAFSKIDAEVISEPWGLGLMIGVLGINISLSSWQRYWARKMDSEILLADASHTFGDVLTTIVVIVGWQLSALGYSWLDKVTALGVAGLIFYIAYSLFKRVIPILVDEISIEPEALIKDIQEIEGVRKVLRVRSRWIGSTKSVDLTVTVDPNLATKDSHAISDNIEFLLEKKFNVKDISIHIDS